MDSFEEAAAALSNCFFLLRTPVLRCIEEFVIMAGRPYVYVLPTMRPLRASEIVLSEFGRNGYYMNDLCTSLSSLQSA